MKTIQTEVEGRDLLCIGTDAFKTELLTLWAPLPYESRTARLCQLMFDVLKQGCRSYPTMTHLNRHLDDLYDANLGTLFYTAGEGIAVGMIAECLAPVYVPEPADLLAETGNVMRRLLTEPLLDAHGLLPAHTLAVEKKHLCDRIRTAENHPRLRAHQLCVETMFRGEPYGHRTFGTADEVEQVSPEDVTAYYHTFSDWFAPHYIYVGARSPEDVRDLLAGTFPAFPRGDAPRPDTLFRRTDTPLREVEESMAVGQGRFVLGFRTDIRPDTDDLYPAILMNDIFGGSASSKLFRHVREEKSLCYSCSSSYDFTKGALFVEAGIANENREQVREAVLGQFEAIRQGQITDDEFSSAKNTLVSSYCQVADAPDGLEAFYRVRKMCGVTLTLEDTIARLARVTKDDVVRVASCFRADTLAFIRGTARACPEEDDFDV